MDQSFELEISFYCDCAICKGHYHDFSNSYYSNAANLEITGNEIDEDDLEEMRRRILNKMDRNLLRADSSVSAVKESDQHHKKQYKQRTPSPFQGRYRKRRFDMAEKEEEDQKKRHRKDGSLYSDSSRYSRNKREDSYERTRKYKAPKSFRTSS